MHDTLMECVLYFAFNLLLQRMWFSDLIFEFIVQLITLSISNAYTRFIDVSDT